MDLGASWAQIGLRLGTMAPNWYWESLLVAPGCSLGGLGSSLIAFGGHLVSIWAPRASKMDAGGPLADIAKTFENHRFSRVLRAGGSFWRLGGALD